jgi:hypothetical protein
MPQDDPALISNLTIQLQDQSNTFPVRDSAAGRLVDIARNHQDYRTQCIAIITATLERYQRNPIELNTLLIKHLIALKAVESAQRVQQVVEAGEYDRGIGDWRQISRELGMAAAAKKQINPPAAEPIKNAAAGADRTANISPDPALAAATISSAPRLSPKQKDKLRAQRKQERKAKKQNRRR